MAVPLTSQAEPIPGYRLLERLGRGGFGEVWKCEAPGGFHKAIKFVYGDLEGAGEDGKPAEQEKKSLERIKSIRHPFILSLERYDIVEGQLMIVMELADRSLWDRFRDCRAEGKPGIPREELLGYMAETAEALDLMNQEHNLQHLDIKPQNLFLVHNHVKVADFGLVKLFEGFSASVTGGVTPVYAAPETFDERVTRFCDQYSLAIVYQELLTGVRPFNGTTTRQLVLQHLSQPPDLEPLPECDRGPVRRALAKKPDDRFPTCSEFVQALRVQAEHHTPSPAALERTPVAASPTPASGLLAAPAAADPRRGSLGPTAHPSVARIPRASELISRPTDPAMTQSVGPAPATLQRPDYANSLSMAQLPVAPEEKTGDGALFPAVVLGVGAVGGRVVRRLRRAMAGRFGGPDATPHLRLLALDTDPAAVNDHSGEGRHLLLARLNRPTHYLTKARDGAVLDWLDPHLLYRMPRNPVTTGLRGLGRLALWDHARAIENRLRVELEAVLEPAALADADKHTGLGLRTNRPRVYVVANLAGGTGGGMFLDLAYLARHALRRLGYARPEVVGVLLLPPADRTAKSPALANAYAALAELHHFSRPESLYELRLSAREPPVVDGDRPFARCLVLPLPGVADEASQRQTAGLVAGLLLRELLAPLGRVADEARAAATKPGDHLAFCHTAAAYRLSAPRRRLTRHAGLRLSEHLLRQWTAKEATALRAPVGAWLDEQWEARQIRPELVIDRVHELCRAAVGQDPDTKFDALVAPLAERGALGTKLDARSACQVLDDLVELVGKPAEADADGAQQGLLRQAVERSLQALSAEYDQKLAEMAVHFIELPQYRLAGADETIRQLGERLRQVLATYEGMSKGLSREAADYYARLMGLLGALDAAGGRRNANATAGEVMELLRAYPRKRYQALVAGFALSIYRSMLNTAPEYLREVNFCRQRLGEVLAALEQAVATEADRRTPLGPSLEVYPGGARTLDEAAGQLIALLTPEDLLDLDGRVQQQVRRQFRAVVNYCLESNGPTGPLVELLTQQAEEFLTAKLGEAGSADVFFQHFAADPQAAQRAIAQAYQEAEPELAAARAGRGAELTVLAVPAGTAGDHLRVLAEQTLAGVTLRPAHSPDDVVFYRELHGLALTDLPQLGPQARDAYQQALETDHPPHSRKDVVWQLPVRNSTA